MYKIKKFTYLVVYTTCMLFIFFIKTILKKKDYDYIICIFVIQAL